LTFCIGTTWRPTTEHRSNNENTYGTTERFETFVSDMDPDRILRKTANAE
jgi:hypothetical protein